MKITTILIFFSLVNTYAVGYSQQEKISIHTKNTTLRDVMSLIEKESGYKFLYNDDYAGLNKEITIDAEQKPISDILEEVLQNTGTGYKLLENKLIVVVPMAYMQQRITGTVVDAATGEPVVGAVIKIEGTTQGVVSDENGKFSIDAPGPNAILLVSFLGYNSERIEVSNRSSVDIKLIPDIKGLDEVVVVGYGTQKKVNLTGAVSTVSGDDMLKRPVTSTAAMLQGKMPGVQIVQSTGEPGNEGVSIQIRGMGTYSSAGSDPLVLIDGVQGYLSDVDPNNVENISVLKDAASAAIYGSRAANGVILVTTKTGKEGKMKIEYNGNYSISKPTKMLDLITNSADYMTLYNEARINSGLTDPNFLYPQDQIDLYRNATDRNLYPNTDWLGLIFRNAPTQIHNLSLSGGNGGTVYNATFGYTNQEGVMKGFNYERYNARLNVSSHLKDIVKFGANIGLKSGKRETPENSSQDVFLSAMAQAPTYGPYVADGSGRYTYKAYSFEYNNKNPVALLDKNISHTTTDYAVNSQAWFELHFTKSFSWFTKAAFNGNFDKYQDYKTVLPLYYFRDPDTNPVTNLDLGSGMTDQDEYTLYSNIYSYLNYEHNFNGHGIKAQIGYSSESSTYRYLQGSRSIFATDILRELNAGSPAIQNAYGTENGWALNSWFGRLSYNYKERYLFEANLRYDGSSKLTPSSRWGVFPSFSAAWRASEEKFVKDLNLSWLDNLKIRGSYGQVGNQNIGNYPYQTLLNFTGNYSFDNANLNTGVAQTALANTNIKWETTNITDVGLDVTVLHDLNVTADWYKKRTTDILRPSQVTYLVGLDAPTVNNGIMENTGVELGVTYNHTVKDGPLSGLTYAAGVNLEHYKNTVVKYGDAAPDGYRIYKEGQEWGAYYMLECTGIFQSDDEIKNSPKQYSDATVPGDLKFKDQNGDGKVDDNDRVIINGNFPLLNYSYNVSLNWKGFDLYAMFQGVDKVKYFVTDWGTIPFVQGAPPTTNWYDRWTDSHHSTTTPRLYWGWSAPEKIRRNSTYYLHDASYLRLKNLVFGYTIPAKITNRIGITDLRIFFSGDNLLTKTSYPGLDPERGSSGSYVQYPQNKVYSFGLNVKF